MKVQIEFFALQNLCKYCHAVTKCLHPHNLTLLYGRSWGECNVDDCPFCVYEVDDDDDCTDT